MKQLHTLLELKRLLLLRHMGYRYVTPRTYEEVTVSSAPFASLSQLCRQVRNCHLCTLSKRRKYTVCGTGASQADVMFVAEYPGLAEDDTGQPFVGKSGDMIHKMAQRVLGLAPQQYYMTYALKCMPHEGEDRAACMLRCATFIAQETELVAPKAVILFGKAACYHLLQNDEACSKVHGTLHMANGRIYMLTHSLLYLQRNPEAKKETLHHLRQVAHALTSS